MTVLGRYLAAASQPDMFSTASGFDEFAAPDGTVRQGWSILAEELDEFAEMDLLQAQREVERLLEDDKVTYTPNPAAAISIADETDGRLPVINEPQPWKLDPLPLILDDREWSRLETGLVQRAELLDAIMADLYGARALLANGTLPPSAIFDHDEYLRPVIGAAALTSQRLFTIAVDLGRNSEGQWKVISDRTQAPSGAGYAMQNRRVVSRVLPEVYQQANLHRLTPFFQAMRIALVDAASRSVEDPRVVVLSPGTHSETAFDQAFVASLLGFPLLEGSDLTVRDGRVWMRVLGKLEQVDVILRRVDSAWSDPLELRAGSRLGVTGLVECVRQGTVSVVNNIGSLVIRPISRGHGRSVIGSALTADQREQLTAKIKALPHRYVGQEVLQLSSVPTSQDDRLVRREVVLRSFAVRSDSSYIAMLGGLARVNDESNHKGPLVTSPDGGVAKDVWIVGREPITAVRIAAPRRLAEAAGGLVPTVSTSAAMVPRVLSDMFWFGRYAERAEDLLRLILAARTVAIETDRDTTQGHALEVLLHAVTHVSTTYPGFLADDVAVMPELRSMVLDRHRAGTVSQSVGALSSAAQGVRDQLSEDVWMVLAEVERALHALAANPYDQGLQLTDASERVLSGLLALSGIVSENMVRDPGWYMLDSGRGLERALQVLALLRVTACTERPPETDRLVTEAVLTAAESIVTFRRRYRLRARMEGLVELLVLDPFNPRSAAFQLSRVRTDLLAIPSTSPTARQLRLLDGMIERVRNADLVELCHLSGGERPALAEFLSGLQTQLRDLSETIRAAYQQLPPAPRPMYRSNDVGSPAGAGVP